MTKDKVVLAFTAGVLAGYGVKCYLSLQKRLLEDKRKTKAHRDHKEETSVMYKVQVTVDHAAVEAFEKWIPVHIQDLLALPGFIEAEWLSVALVKPKPKKPQVVFVLGGPGAGKGTQCDKIVQEFGYVHISAGDCLRAERNRASKDAQLINQYIQEGQIVPVEITVRLLKKAMDASGQMKFLIDGFPRNLDNVNGWFNVMGDSVTVEFVLFLDCPEHVMERRLLQRGKTSGRVDDNLTSIKKRFKTYENETKPIIDYFAQQGKVRHVVADASIDQVWLRVRSHVAPTTLESKSKSESKSESESERRQYVIQYRLKDQAALDQYLLNSAPEMRARVQASFPEHHHLEIERACLTSLARFGP